MIWIRIKYKFQILTNLFLFKIGFANFLLKNRYGEQILVFHGIDRIGEIKYNSRFHSESFFSEFINYINKNYNIISLKDYYNKKFQPNTLNIAITFDDGYLNNYKYAISVLEKNNIPATFFITAVQEMQPFLWPDFLDLVSYYSFKKEIIFENKRYKKNKKNEFVNNGVSLKNECKKLPFHKIELLFSIFKEEWKTIQDKNLDDYWQLMSIEEIKKISRNHLFTIGSHSLTHSNLASISIEEAKSEILKGKIYIENICNRSISEFAFPFGSYNSELVDFCKEIGLSKILLLDYNCEEDKKNNSLKNRFVMNPHISLENQLSFLLKGKYI